MIAAILAQQVIKTMLTHLGPERQPPTKTRSKASSAVAAAQGRAR
jgi:hypothetical protein